MNVMILALPQISLGSGRSRASVLAITPDSSPQPSCHMQTLPIFVTMTFASNSTVLFVCVLNFREVDWYRHHSLTFNCICEVGAGHLFSPAVFTAVCHPSVSLNPSVSAVHFRVCTSSQKGKVSASPRCTYLQLH